MSAAERGTLRLGLLLNGTTVERWQAEAIRQALAVPGVSLVVVVTPAPEHAPPLPFLQRLLRKPWGTALYRRYRRHRFRPGAMAPEDIAPLLVGVPHLACRPEPQGRAQRFTAGDLDALRGHRPDVLLRFGFGILTGPILQLAPHGVWSFHHGDPAKFRGGPPGLWEILRGDPVTGAILQRLGEKLDAGMILRQGWFGTVDHSLKETVDTVLMQSAVWPAQVLRELVAGHSEAANGTACATPGPLYRYPGNFTFLRFLWKQAMNKLRFHRRELQVHEDWNVGILYRPIHELVDDDMGQNLRWLPPPAPENYRADPFGYIAADGQLNVLYEKYDHATGRGEIARMRPKKDNVLKRSRTLLGTTTHLSYPYVVQRPDGIFVVPEQAEAGSVELYRVNATNDALDPVCTLLDEAVYDPTLFEHEGRWWLLGTKAPLSNVALYAWHSERLEGPYTPHALNPIKFDIRSARPGGTPFMHNGHLYRPAQDSSRTYGWRIALNRVITLTPERFAEETVRHIGPVAGSEWSAGLHTLSAVGDVTLIDGKRLVTVPERRKAVKQRKLEKLKRALDR